MNYHEATMHEVRTLHEELSQILDAEGRGPKKISRTLESMLKLRVLDRNLDELKYFVFTDNTEDAELALTHISELIQD